MANVTGALIEQARMAGRITTNAFDKQIGSLLNAAMLDMGIAGVEIPERYDALVSQAASTYFLMNFGQPDEYDRLKKSYDEQKAQLSMATGYTKWGD